MKIENLVKIVDEDVEILTDRNKVILEYIESVKKFSYFVGLYNSNINWAIGKFLSNLFSKNENIIYHPKRKEWKIFGNKYDVYYEDKDKLFLDNSIPYIQINYYVLEEATTIKPESICRIQVARGGIKNTFDILVRQKNYNTIMQSDNYNKYLANLINKGLLIKELNGKVISTNSLIDIQDYKAIKNHISVMSEVVSRNKSEKNAFIFIYRGEEHDGNEEKFQVFFEKLLDNVYCLK